MKIKVHVNFVCDVMLNSAQNIDYVFEVERTLLPQKKVLLGGLYCVIEESVYDIVKDQAKIYATCYYPRNKVSAPDGGIDVDKAQQVTFDTIAYLAEKYGLSGTYTSRNICNRQVDTDPDDLL